MTKIYGTGAYDFKRHHVAEYLVNLSTTRSETKSTDSKPGSATLPSSITLSEIQRDRLTKIAAENWLKMTTSAAADGGDVLADGEERRGVDEELVKKIYETELKLKEGGKTVPLQRADIGS